MLSFLCSFINVLVSPKSLCLHYVVQLQKVGPVLFCTCCADTKGLKEQKYQKWLTVQCVNQMMLECEMRLETM